jgi:CubicO group peptidase (beta-lactamase class C family)
MVFPYNENGLDKYNVAVVGVNSGPNPTTSIYNASVAKTYIATLIA